MKSQFDWDERARELGYPDYTEMLRDLIEEKRLPFTTASRIVGTNVYYKATRLGFHTGRKRGGPVKRGYRLLDRLQSTGIKVREIIEESRTVEEAAVRLGVSPSIVSRWKRENQ